MEYFIWRELPCYTYGGGQQFGALRTNHRPWKEFCDTLPTDMAEYAYFEAPNMRAAVAEAKKRWNK